MRLGWVRVDTPALARQAGLPLGEKALLPADLEAADEMFLTSTVREVVPVVRLGDRAIGSGRPGPVTGQLHEAFRRRATRRQGSGGG